MLTNTIIHTILDHSFCSNHLNKFLVFFIGWFVRFMVFIATFNKQYFSYIVVVNFISRGSRSTRRKPPTCRKSLTNFIT